MIGSVRKIVNEKKLISLLLCFAMQCVSMFAVAENPAVQGKVTEVEKYGHARLDITFEETTSIRRAHNGTDTQLYQGV